MNYSIFFQIYFIKLMFPKYWFLPTALIYSQGAHETGNFTSTIFKENKNIFGMKLPRVRKTLATGSNRGHATFNNLYDSIYDYFLRQEAFNITYSNLTQYVEDTFNSGYAEDMVYREKWLTHYYSNGILRYISFIFIPTIFLIAFYFIDPNYFKKFW